MGLDSVELVMEVEDAFNISIPDNEASEIRTIGDMYACVLAKVDKHRAKESCVSQRLFYKLRRCLIEQANVSCNRIRPGEFTEKYFPRRGRNQLWKQFSEKLDLRFPGLRRPLWVIIVPAWLFVVITTCVWFLLEGSVAQKWIEPSLPLFFIWLPIYFVFFLYATRSLAVEIPSHCKTIGGLAKSLVTKNFAKVSEGQFTDADVWNTICMIISEQLNVDIEKLQPETKFVPDLGF